MPTPTIVIISSDPNVLEVQQWLEGQFRIVTAESSEVGFSMVEEEDPSIVVIDQEIRLSDECGIEFSDHIRESNDGILMILIGEPEQMNEEQIRAAYVDHGFDVCLPKPPGQEFLARMQQTFNRREGLLVGV